MKKSFTLNRWKRRRRVDESSLMPEHRDALYTRRAEALAVVGATTPAGSRAAQAPPAYVLAHTPGDIARHCALLDPLAVAGEVRVVVTPGKSAALWHVDITARDRHGLLAAFTGVLEQQELDVTQAVIATWDDGAALQAFTVRSAVAPDPDVLRLELESSLTEALSSPPSSEARIRFDHEASVLFTRCDVRAPDRVGLLHSLSVAFAAAGADVHGASVSTVDGIAVDSFDLSTATGEKLPLEMEAHIERLVRDGVGQLGGSRRGFGRPRAGRMAAYN